ncbi:hypothetical protein [Desulfuromonas thiophila]|uniref:hypothetical protein n=1 Tax=Desulfuromonas thiophila TaxID=57664 RepID=UPI0029F49B5C|nr:hypothetical protein [Desulfuromonas thiophila]
MLTKIKPNNAGLLTTQDYEELPPQIKSKLCNGMGSQQTWWNRLLFWLIPDHFFGLDMAEAGNIHDFMYWQGGSLWGKIVADLVFLYNMLRLIHNAGPKHRLKRYFMATRYYLAVFWGGRGSFNFRQKD